ncbi:T9SS type A sorting domain-containing protein [Flavobacterium sp.]|uniref:T9SS type A sorting domain-containing protein n=1 Tax=Flavobacterium sp. TaxID=239 RepID=UPI003752C0F2
MKTLIISIFSILTIAAQERNPFYIGHSLVNFNMPAMVHGMAVDAGKTTHYGSQVANGSPLHINYNNYATAQGTPYPSAFPAGNYNSLIITEAVPLQPHLSWSNTYLYANNFYSYANNNYNPIKFYIYETWHCKNSGIPQPTPGFETGCEWDTTTNSNTLWHPRLLLDFPLWSGIVTHVRNQNPTDTEIWMVPAGQALYNLTTRINAGQVPGITSFTNLFLDDIHLTNAGNYFVACVMYASIYGESPVGLSQNLNDMWGTPFTSMPTNTQATIMQQVAWETVTNLSSWTGVSNLSNIDFVKNNLSIYPNPAKNTINIESIENEAIQKIKINDFLGKTVQIEKSNLKTINIENLAQGIYVIEVTIAGKVFKNKFIKN